MGWDEIVGFLVVIFVFIIPLLRRLLLDKKRVEQQKREEELRAEEEEEPYYEEAPLPPPLEPLSEPLQPPPRPTTQRLVKRDFEFHTEMEERALESEIEERSLETRIDPLFRERLVSRTFILAPHERGVYKENRILTIMRQKHPRQSMVILSEIFGPPKGLQ